jgi:ATP adenylyltransferase
VTNESIVAMKYNLIITPTFMLIVERRKDKYKDSIGINGVGFTGSILVKNIQQLKELEDVRVVEVLEDVAE